MSTDIFNVEKQVCLHLFPPFLSPLHLTPVDLLRILPHKQRQCFHPYHMCPLDSLVRLFRFPLASLSEIICVLIRSGQVMIGTIPVPDVLPAIHYQINEYLAFDLNWTAIFTAIYLTYYFILEPFAAVSILLDHHIKSFTQLHCSSFTPLKSPSRCLRPLL